jgi:riboflavin biosynthesis pyrimidine reductase
LRVAQVTTTSLPPLETLYDRYDKSSLEIPLPPSLHGLYGDLRLPVRTKRPYVIGNFVTTLDGVVTLNVPGKAGGGPISGDSLHDKMVMGLLRAVSDAVVVGAGTLRAVPNHVWTPRHVSPAHASAYDRLRADLGKEGPPATVIVTGSGSVDLGLPVFESGHAPVLIVTSTAGAGWLGSRAVPPWVDVVEVEKTGRLSAQDVLESVSRSRECEVVLVEGGPQLIGDFFSERLLDELFLTLSPQVAGRDRESHRPGLVEGKVFAPDRPLWGELVGVKRAADHLFLRYVFGAGDTPG